MLDLSYASFTLDRKVANFFRFGQTGRTRVKSGEVEPGILIHLTLHPGAKIIPMYYLQSEDMIPESEVLVARFSRLNLIKRDGHVLYCNLLV